MLRFYTFLILLILTRQAVGQILTPTYPQIPPSYKDISSSGMINDARVNFGQGFREIETMYDGYTVTDPYGNTFVTDDIEEPECTLYLNYVQNDNEPGNSLPIGVEINSNVYVEEVNFDNCQ
jgi:hypothetical protein